MNPKSDTETRESKIPESKSLFRIARLPGFVFLIAGSLLVFPSGLPWMLLVWLGLSLVLVWRKSSPTWSLIMPIGIVIIKYPEWSIALLILLTSFVAVAAYYRISGIHSKTDGFLWILVLVWVYFLVDFQAVASGFTARRDTERNKVVCLGDSLTDYGYPQELQKLIRNPVLDYGRDGITSEDGLKMIDEILEEKPLVVVLELGGHDYNQGRTRRQTADNLSEITRRCHANSANVLIIEVPRGFVRDPFRGIERELARKHNANLISDTLIRKFILFSPICPPGIWLSPEYHLSRDGLHPNENGNRLFAKTVADKLGPLIGEENLK